jgi:hypothetical protein
LQKRLPIREVATFLRDKAGFDTEAAAPKTGALLPPPEKKRPRVLFGQFGSIKQANLLLYFS